MLFMNLTQSQHVNTATLNYARIYMLVGWDHSLISHIATILDAVAKYNQAYKYLNKELRNLSKNNTETLENLLSYVYK